MATVSDLISKGYGGYQGWGEAEAAADFKATGGQGKYTGSNTTGGNSGDFQGMVQQAQQMYSQANKPAIESLQASKPEIAAGYERERESLAAQESNMKTRYQNLLSDIKGRETKETNQATKITAGELGKRGIAPGGTFYEQEIQGAQQPISQYYGGLTRDIGQAQSEEQTALSQLGGQLTTQETGAYRDLANTIAQLQSAGGSNAIQTALQQYQQAEQSRQSELDRLLQQEQFSQQLNQPFTLGEGQSLYNPQTGQIEFTVPNTYAPSTDLFEQLIKNFGKEAVERMLGINTGAGNTIPGATSTFTPIGGLDFTNPYSAGNSGSLK